jgi:hypothetical protein
VGDNLLNDLCIDISQERGIIDQSEACVGHWSHVLLNNGQDFNYFPSSVSSDFKYAWGFIEKSDITHIYCKMPNTTNYTLLPTTNIPTSCEKSWLWLNLKGSNRNFWFYYYSPSNIYLYGAISLDNFKAVSCPHA